MQVFRFSRFEADPGFVPSASGEHKGWQRFDFVTSQRKNPGALFHWFVVNKCK